MERTIADSAALGALLAEAEAIPDAEIWITSPAEVSLCALMNANCGWLMFLRFPGDAGYSSCNPTRADDGEQEAFRLPNGQVDSYPRVWTFPRSVVLRALREFAETGQRPDGVEWHDDGA